MNVGARVGHAALAWSTLSWLVDEGGDEVRDAIRALEADAPTPRREPPMLSSVVLTNHGVIPFADAVTLDRETRRTIIDPALARLGV